MGKRRETMEVDNTLDETTTEDKDEKDSYDAKLHFVSIIAKPMASKSVTKKLYKLIKKASKEKNMLRAGLKDVQRRIRRGETGICILAGDVSPVDVICHIPAVCEEKSIPYCYTPSRVDLGAAMGVKRGSVMMLVRPHDSYQALYLKLTKELKSMPVPLDGCNFPQGNL